MSPQDDTPVAAESLRDMVDERRIAYNWREIERKRRWRAPHPGRRRFVLAAAAIILATAGAVAAAYLYEHPTAATGPLSFELAESTRMIAVPSRATRERRIPLSDGSTITLAPGASLEVLHNAPERFRTSLHQGWVRYNVIPVRARTWEVDAGLCRIRILGTQFTVNRTPAQVQIAVHRGTVAVYPPSGGRRLVTLTSGETYALRSEPEQAPPPAPPPVMAEASRPDPKKRPAHIRRPRPAPAPARNSLPVRAAATPLAGLSASERVNTLLSKVDAARNRDQPREAARLLERLLRDHPADPAAGLAALTLGNLRMDILGQPGAAARAFQQATAAKALPPALREQAYARCAEAFHRAGDAASARQVADRYRRRYPEGDWRSWFERFSE